MSMGCANDKFATYEGAGKAFPRAEYQILGKTSYDQRWISETIEAEVVGFKFARPQERPPALDAAPAQHSVVERPAVPATLTTPGQPAVVSVVPKKPGLWKRFKARFHKKKPPPTE
jgi:hypothetical protein